MKWWGFALAVWQLPLEEHNASVHWCRLTHSQNIGASTCCCSCAPISTSDPRLLLTCWLSLYAADREGKRLPFFFAPKRQTVLAGQTCTSTSDMHRLNHCQEVMRQVTQYSYVIMNVLCILYCSNLLGVISEWRILSVSSMQNLYFLYMGSVTLICWASYWVLLCLNQVGYYCFWAIFT